MKGPDFPKDKYDLNVKSENYCDGYNIELLLQYSLRAIRAAVI